MKVGSVIWLAREFGPLASAALGLNLEMRQVTLNLSPPQTLSARNVPLLSCLFRLIYAYLLAGGFRSRSRFSSTPQNCEAPEDEVGLNAHLHTHLPHLQVFAFRAFGARAAPRTKLCIHQ